MQFAETCNNKSNGGQHRRKGKKCTTMKKNHPMQIVPGKRCCTGTGFKLETKPSLRLCCVCMVVCSLQFCYILFSVLFHRLPEPVQCALCADASVVCVFLSCFPLFLAASCCYLYVHRLLFGYEGTELSKLHTNTNTGWLNPSYPTSQRLEPLRQRLITVGRFGGFVLFPVVLAFLPRSLPKMICVVEFRISIQFPSALCSTSNSPARIIATDSAK